MNKTIILAFIGTFISSLASSDSLSSCIETSRDNDLQDPFVIVNDNQIGTSELVATLKLEAKQRFYHAEAPEAQTDVFYLEIRTDLINTRILSNHAFFERNLPIDQKKLQLKDMELSSELEAQDLTSEQIDYIKTFYLCQLERAEIVKALRKQVESQSAINDDDVNAYYLAHPDKFTSPERNRLGLILFGVDPSAPATAWVDTKKLADIVYQQLGEGADFAELASIHSTDISARHGGDMGYQHLGMLGREIEEQAKELNKGEYTEPMYLLEGWAIVKLLDREPASLNPLKAVQERAAALALRDKTEQDWNSLIEQLNAEATIQYLDNK